MAEIGETLRERRMSMKIDVHEVEEKTKIRAKYLRALENEEYNLLPGEAYVKSFIRTYAEFLGLDSRALVDSYRAIDKPEEESPIFPARDGTRKKLSGRWILLAIAIVVILVILFLVGAIGG
jgi:cytoskeletal protein RodZ